MHRIVIADPLEASGVEILRSAGAEVVVVGAQDKARLGELVADAHALVVRSATKVTRELLEKAPNLLVVGRAGIGVDNVDVTAATERGVLVVNAPTANVMSATEHTFALLLALARRVPAADASMKRGEWDRKSFLGTELEGKTLGVVGFGRIGQRVAARARGFEMKVVAFDPFLDAAVAARHEVELVALDELCDRADVVTLHTPLTAETRHLLGARQLARLKPGSLVVHCGRGGTLDEAALLEGLAEGRIAGAAIDVWEEEPTSNHSLIGHPNVVATPHIGAQTAEAQERIAQETARMVLAALEGSLAIAAVNLPFHSTGRRESPYLHLGDRLGRLVGGLSEGRPERIEVTLRGLADELAAPTTVAIVRGALARSLGEAVNYVNAEHLAATRGIEIARTTARQSGGYPELVSVRFQAAGESFEVAGALFGEGEVRVVKFGGYRL
ncbi:MAG TPA: phosphoglycerate dehydrogenase, partial [Thermoanaerobaculia bacterium]|nr:phosphoglycerate dehydrogenase [Thermoanaerobaculia bacterium]